VTVWRLPNGCANAAGASLRRTGPAPDPEWELCPLAERPKEMPCSFRRVRWLDFRLPADRRDARAAFAEAHALARRYMRVHVKTPCRQVYVRRLGDAHDHRIAQRHQERTRNRR
jgi:hypothetical protein